MKNIHEALTSLTDDLALEQVNDARAVTDLLQKMVDKVVVSEVAGYVQDITKTQKIIIIHHT